MYSNPNTFANLAANRGSRSTARIESRSETPSGSSLTLSATRSPVNPGRPNAAAVRDATTRNDVNFTFVVATLSGSACAPEPSPNKLRCNESSRNKTTPTPYNAAPPTTTPPTPPPAPTPHTPKPTPNSAAPPATPAPTTTPHHQQQRDPHSAVGTSSGQCPLVTRRLGTSVVQQCWDAATAA